MLVSAQSEFIILVSARSEFNMLVSARSDLRPLDRAPRRHLSLQSVCPHRDGTLPEGELLPKRDGRRPADADGVFGARSRRPPTLVGRCSDRDEHDGLHLPHDPRRSGRAARRPSHDRDVSCLSVLAGGALPALQGIDVLSLGTDTHTGQLVSAQLDVAAGDGLSLSARPPRAA